LTERRRCFPAALPGVRGDERAEGRDDPVEQGRFARDSFAGLLGRRTVLHVRRLARRAP